MAINKVILLGNVGKDPEIRFVESQTPVCTLAIATSETYTNRTGEKVTNTEWHNVVLWRNLASLAEKYIRKGDMIYVEGKIRTRTYNDKDGNKKYVTEIIADNIQLTGKKQSSSDFAPSAAGTSTDQQPLSNVSDDLNTPGTDDLPF